jgi:parallel beta-helix repeat protein
MNVGAVCPAAVFDLPGKGTALKQILRFLVVAGLMGAVAGHAKAASTPVTSGDMITAPGKYYLSGNCTGPGIVILASDVDLNLAGRTLTGSDADQIGIFVYGVSNVHVHDGNLANVKGGVYLDGTSNCRVDHVRVQMPYDTGESAFAIYDGGSNNRIDFNTATAGAGGGGYTMISLYGPASGNNISNNVINGGFFGIVAAGANNTTVKANVISNASYGIYDAVGWNNGFSANIISQAGIGIILDNSSMETVRENSVQGFDFGIYLGGGGENKLIRNTVSGSFFAGINLTYSFGNRMEGNCMSSNTFGLYIEEGCLGNVVKSNTAQGNSELDLVDVNSGPILPNTWLTNTFNTSNQPGVIH